MSSLEKCLFRSFAHFVMDCLSSWCAVMWVLYIFWRSNPANILHSMVGSLFILLIFSLSMQKLFILFVYSFLCVPFSRGHIGENIAVWNIWDFPAYILHQEFMVSWLLFKSFIHLDFIFVYGVSWWSSFILLLAAVQISQNHLLKRLF